MMIVHVELRRETFLKVLCIDDDGFVHKKLFLSGIEEFRKVPQIILQPNVALNGSVQVPRCSAESVHDNVEESKAPVNEQKRSSIGQGFL